MKYKSTDFKKYGVVDTKALEDRERAFHDLFESIANEQKAYLDSIIREQKRKQRSKHILDNIDRRKQHE